MPLFFDGSTEASRPARLPVRWRTHLWFHPFWPALSVLTALGGLGAALFSRPPTAAWGAILASALFLLLHVDYHRTRCARGMLCPGLVIAEAPRLIAVWTDLSFHPDSSHPAVKVLPVPRLPGAFPVGVGTRMAMVTLYREATLAGHWSDCVPAPACQANGLPAVHEELLRRIPETEWAALEAAVLKLPRPFKGGLVRCVAAPGRAFAQSQRLA